MVQLYININYINIDGFIAVILILYDTLFTMQEQDHQGRKWSTNGKEQLLFVEAVVGFGNINPHRN